MQALLDKLQSIESKIKEQLKELAELRLDNSTLKQENEKLSAIIDRQKESLKELEQKLLVERKGYEGVTDKDAVKKKLEHYIEEIDKCIEMVNSVE